MRSQESVPSGDSATCDRFELVKRLDGLDVRMWLLACAAVVDVQAGRLVWEDRRLETGCWG